MTTVAGRWQRFPPGHQPAQRCANCGITTERPKAAGWVWRELGGGGRQVQCPKCRVLEARYAEGGRSRPKRWPSGYVETKKA